MVLDNNCQKVNVPHVIIGESTITPSAKIRNLGAILDSIMSSSAQVSNIVRTGSYQIRNIGRIRKYLNQNATEQIVHSFVTSRLDMCNSLLIGLPQDQLTRLQRLQNTSARLIKLIKKRAHITPVLKELHWLPVGARIKYKILITVFKALNDLAPDYIAQFLQFHNPQRSLRSADKSILTEPLT